MKQRFILTLLAVLTSVMSWGQKAVGTTFTASDGNVYKVTKTSPAEVSLNTCNETGDILVATTIKYQEVNYSVTSIDAQTFNKAGIRSVVLPEGVREIGSYTFNAKATDLLAIYLPASLTKFYPNLLCNYIAKIVVASGNTTYESNSDGTILTDKTNHHLLVATNRTVNASIDSKTGKFTSSDDWAVTELTTIDIPKDVVYMDAGSIKSSSYKTTNPVTTISLPSTLTGWDADCWGNHHIANHGWTTIKITGNDNFEADDGILYSADGTILYKAPICKYKDYMTKGVMKIKDGVEQIAANAFQNCEMMAVEFPSSVTTIADNAFLHCDNLTSVTLGAGVTSVSSNSFASCGKLANIYVDQNNPKYTNGSYTDGVGDGILYGPGETTVELAAWSAAEGDAKALLKKKHLMTCPTARTGTCTVPDNCYVIDKQAFMNSKITTVNLGKDVVEIGEQAFYSAKNLTAIDLHPDPSTSGVTTLGVSAFNDASKLATLKIGANVTEIPQKCFQGCNVTKFTWETPSACTFIAASALTGVNVKTLTIPSSVETVKEYPFSDSTTKVVFADDNGGSHLKSLVGSFSGKTNTKEIVFGSLAYDAANKEMTGSFTPAEGVTIQITGAFTSSGLTSITLPKNCSKLENSAFQYCTGLKHAYFESGSLLQEIGTGVFSNSGLLDISLPDTKLTTVKSNAFENCTDLTYVHVPACTTSIDPQAFSYCSSLTNIDVERKNGTYATSDGMLLTKDKEKLVIYPNGKVSTDFNLLTPSLTEIGEYAFYAANNLTSIVIPKKVETIGNKAFYLCNNLKEITFLGNKPANVEKDAANDEIAAAAWKASHDSKDTSYKNYKDHRFGTDIDQTPADFLAGVRINIRKNAATVTSFTDKVTFTDSNGTEQTVDPYWKGASVRKSFEATNGTRTATAEEKAADATKDFNQFEYLFFGPSTLGIVKGNSTNYTAVVPANAVWPTTEVDAMTGYTVVKGDGNSYSAPIIADYAFEDMPSTVKEMVFLGPIDYVGANAFNNGHLNNTYTANPTSSIENIFFANTADDLGDVTTATTRFGLNSNAKAKTLDYNTEGYEAYGEWGTDNYPEFTATQNIYVPKSKLSTYKTAWLPYAATTEAESQIKYQVPLPQIKTEYGTISREFDVDLADRTDNTQLLKIEDLPIAAFTGKIGKWTSAGTVYVRMLSVNCTKAGTTQECQTNLGDGTYIPANTGVLLKAYKDTYAYDPEKPYYYRIGEYKHDYETDYATVTGAEDNVFQPVVENSQKISFTDDSNSFYNYLISNGGYKSVNSTNGNTMTVHKAYIHLATQMSAAKAPALQFVWEDEDNTATAIQTVDSADVDADKVMYDLSGRRVNNASAKGLYIVNGKKMMIK